LLAGKASIWFEQFNIVEMAAGEQDHRLLAAPPEVAAQ
jgi:hypothetical protein